MFTDVSSRLLDPFRISSPGPNLNHTELPLAELLSCLLSALAHVMESPTVRFAHAGAESWKAFSARSN